MQWSDEGTISSEDLLEYFPDQCFPDIENLELLIGEKALHLLGEDSVGGKEVITQQASPFPVHVYQNGLILQAGKQPLLGDKEQGHSMEPYYTIARVVEPIREKNMPWPIDPSAEPSEWTNAYTLEKTHKWLAQFSPQPE